MSELELKINKNIVNYLYLHLNLSKLKENRHIYTKLKKNNYYLDHAP